MKALKRYRVAIFVAASIILFPLMTIAFFVSHEASYGVFADKNIKEEGQSIPMKEPNPIREPMFPMGFLDSFESGRIVNGDNRLSSLPYAKLIHSNGYSSVRSVDLESSIKESSINSGSKVAYSLTSLIRYESEESILYISTVTLSVAAKRIPHGIADASYSTDPNMINTGVAYLHLGKRVGLWEFSKPVYGCNNAVVFMINNEHLITVTSNLSHQKILDIVETGIEFSQDE